MTDTSNRFLRLNAVLDKTGLSRSTLYRKVQEGTFPKQITIGVRCVAWREMEIEEWMSNPMFYEASDHRPGSGQSGRGAKQDTASPANAWSVSGQP